MTKEVKGSPFNGDKYMQNKFLELKDQFKISHVIETGTFHGSTTKWLAENFDEVLTIENNKAYQDIAIENLKDAVNRDKIQLWLGSSSERLGDMIQDCKENSVLVFLDAHWYKNPVLQELDQIAEIGAKPILAIHDFQNPLDPTMGYDIYPEQGIVYNWSWIESRIEKIYGKDGYQVGYNTQAEGARRGCIFITPLNLTV